MEAGHTCLGLSRRALPGLQQVDYQQRAKLHSLLFGYDCLVHLAGVAHQPSATEHDYEKGNVDLTATMVNVAKDCGINHVIMISSVKAMGEETAPNQPFTHSSDCKPEDHYGQSKLNAEITLKQRCKTTGVKWTIIRPPLVYSADAGGNIAKLKQAINKGWPLPFAGIDNRRDIVSLPTLNSLIERCVSNAAAHNQVFLASDGGAMSTESLVRKIASDCKLQPKLAKPPKAAIQLLKALPLTKNTVRKLTGNLELDISHTCTTLGWQPEDSKANNS
ncbi:SDR family oxidoreductase [Halioxenophilus aromaticivorans]|uniref:SDR family oxidoreductase n=2 Tax=Halioxenophilus aromaticivorans TaxID=1306992 RepID=A0AAV3TZN4_9ALTE